MKWRRIQGMLLSYYYITKNSLDRQWDIFLWPVVEILIWGFMTFFINTFSSTSVTSPILTSILLWMFFWRGSNDFVVFLLENYWSKNIYHLFVTPLTNIELIISLGLIGFLRSLVSAAILSVLSFILYSVNIFNINPVHALLFIFLLVLCSWAVGMLVASCIIILGTRVQVLAWGVVWIIQPFSCVFYPLQALPKTVQYFAWLLPTTHVFEGVRASLSDQPLNYFNIIYALIVVIILFVAAVAVFSQAIAIAKKKGRLAKPE